MEEKLTGGGVLIIKKYVTLVDYHLIFNIYAIKNPYHISR